MLQYKSRYVMIHVTIHDKIFVKVIHVKKCHDKRYNTC